MNGVYRYARQAQVRRVYKFRSFEPLHPEYISRMFTHHELYFPSPTHLTDPFECKPFIRPPALSTWAEKWRAEREARSLLIRNGTSRNEAKARAKSAKNPDFMATRAAEMTAELPRDMESYRICSFSSKWDSLLLWSHYAGAHQGICLEFDAENDDFGSALEIQYSDDYPSMDFFDRDPDRLLKSMILTKASDWQYESEYRLITKVPHLHPQIQVVENTWAFPPERLVGVIMGCEISPKNEAIVREFVSSYESSVTLQRAVRSNHEYAIKLP